MTDFLMLAGWPRIPVLLFLLMVGGVVAIPNQLDIFTVLIICWSIAFLSWLVGAVLCSVVRCLP